jgi:transposase
MKTKTMTFKGRDTVRSKIVISNNNIEQINTFIYPGYSISYQSEKDVTGKISKFLHITGIIDRIFKSSQVQKYTRLKIYNILVLKPM